MQLDTFTLAALKKLTTAALDCKLVLILRERAGTDYCGNDYCKKN